MPAPRHVDDAERRHRLAVRHDLDGSARDVLTCVEDLVALHSSDPATPYLGLAARVGDFEIAELDRALLTDRTLWRLHAMRRTLWIVPTAHAPDVLAGASVEVGQKERRRLQRWVAQSTGRPAQTWIAALEEEVLQALAGGRVRSTRELSEAIPELTTPIELGAGRWRTTSPIASRLLFVMAMDGRIVRAHTAGSWRASQYGWASTGEWFDDRGHGRDPHHRAALDPRRARARLLDRWLSRFGPASTRDVRWWTGWTAAQSAAALADCGAQEVTTDAGTGWVAADDEGPPTGPASPTVALLPALDPTTMGWKERGFAMGDLAELGGALFDRNGNAGPTVWVDGRVVGGWGQVPTGEVVVRMLADVGAQAQAAVDRKAAALTRWLEGAVVTPRFRTPLERAIADPSSS